MNQPDPKLHMLISFAKSACRIIAGVLLAVGVFKTAGLMFIIAEALGIGEELV
jgi:uncharacterized membrane protein